MRLRYRTMTARWSEACRNATRQAQHPLSTKEQLRTLHRSSCEACAGRDKARPGSRETLGFRHLTGERAKPVTATSMRHGSRRRGSRSLDRLEPTVPVVRAGAPPRLVQLDG